jgi:hypothetical protein
MPHSAAYPGSDICSVAFSFGLTSQLTVRTHLHRSVKKYKSAPERLPVQTDLIQTPKRPSCDNKEEQKKTGSAPSFIFARFIIRPTASQYTLTYLGKKI